MSNLVKQESYSLPCLRFIHLENGKPHSVKLLKNKWSEEFVEYELKFEYAPGPFKVTLSVASDPKNPSELVAKRTLGIIHVSYPLEPDHHSLEAWKAGQKAHLELPVFCSSERNFRQEIQFIPKSEIHQALNILITDFDEEGESIEFFIVPKR